MCVCVCVCVCACVLCRHRGIKPYIPLSKVHVN